MPSSDHVEVTRRVITATGSTDGNGDYVVAFSPAFDATPHLAPAILNQANPNQKVRISAASASGCTLRVEVQNQSFLALLGVDVLTSGVTPVSGASVCLKATSHT